MIVDPNTGMPMDDGYGLTSQRMPLLYSIMQNTPSATVTSGWNIRRSMNTILKGGSNPGENIGAFRMTAFPRYFNRFPDARNVMGVEGVGSRAGLMGRAEGAWHSPIGQLSGASNWVAKQAAARVAPNSALGAEPAFGVGTVSRIGAAFQLQPGASTYHAMNFLREANPGYHAMLNTDYGLMEGSVREGLLMGKGVLSNRVTGYLSGAAARRAGMSEATSFLARETESAAGKAFVGAAEKGFAHMGLETGLKAVAPRAALFAAEAVPVVNIVATALLVKDLVNMGVKGVAAGVRGVGDAVISAKGSIDKPVMGMGFKDNSVAATSRQRGVQAISNSRLNMRSALGSEASALHAYWG